MFSKVEESPVHRLGPALRPAFQMPVTCSLQCEKIFWFIRVTLYRLHGSVDLASLLRYVVYIVGFQEKIIGEKIST